MAAMALAMDVVSRQFTLSVGGLKCRVPLRQHGMSFKRPMLNKIFAHEAKRDYRPSNVQSMERANFAATPAHPESLSAMYASYVAACFTERVWRFGLPVVLSVLFDNLLPVAILSFVGQLVIFLCGPLLGSVMDSMPRVISFNILSVLQTVSMLASAGVVVYALHRRTLVRQAHILQPWFVILIVAGSLERISGLAAGVAFERDWVVLLAGANRSIALANANAILRRVDLICEIAGPFLFGLLLSRYNPVTCIYIAATAMAASLPILIFLVHCTYDLSKGVLDRPTAQELRKHTFSISDRLHSLKDGLFGIKESWQQYFAQPILPASAAFVLLYFNAILGPSGLMTSFLTQQGLNPSIVGTFRGLCALMGLLATFVSATLIRKIGVLKAGATALVFQATTLVAAVAVYQLSHKASLVAFLFLIVVSRLGFWVYDMVDAQIFQTAVAASQANKVGTTEVALASFAELMMMGVAIIANDATHFGKLAVLSMSAVVGATCIYCHWLSTHPSLHSLTVPATATATGDVL